MDRAAKSCSCAIVRARMPVLLYQTERKMHIDSFSLFFILTFFAFLFSCSSCHENSNTFQRNFIRRERRAKLFRPGRLSQVENRANLQDFQLTRDKTAYFESTEKTVKFESSVIIGGDKVYDQLIHCCYLIIRDVLLENFTPYLDKVETARSPELRIFMQNHECEISTLRTFASNFRMNVLGDNFLSYLSPSIIWYIDSILKTPVPKIAFYNRLLEDRTKVLYKPDLYIHVSN